MADAGFRRISGGVSWLGLHLVWCPKCRRRILGGRVAVRCGEPLDEIGTVRGGQVVAKEVMPDRVYLFVRVSSTDVLAEVIRRFKGRTARVLGEKFRYLRARATVLWSPAYVAASVGYVSESTVRRDIAHQWDGIG